MPKHPARPDASTERVTPALPGRRTWLAAAMLTALAPAAATAADAYPTRPIKLVLGFPPGGATDTSSRVVAGRMATVLGQQIVVENRPGASGNIAAEQLAHSPADGYTMMYTTSTIHGINPNVYARLPYDPIKDFSPVMYVSRTPMVLLVNNNVPASSAAELIALAGKSPGRLTYGSAGLGSTAHLAGALFAKRAGVDMLHVPYKGSIPAMTDLMAGQVDAVFDTVTASLPFIRGGKVRALGVASLKPTTAVPDLATIDSSGVPGFQVTAWGGFVVPAGTPAPIIATLNAAANEAIRSPEVRQKILETGEIEGGSPEVFGKWIRDELAFWQKTVNDIGLPRQ